MRLNRAYLKLVKQVLLAVPVLYFVLVMVMHVSDPEQVSTPGAEYRLSLDTSPVKIFKEGDPISVLVDNIKPVGCAMDNEISLRHFDYYDKQFQFDKLAPQQSQVAEFVHSNGFMTHIMKSSSYMRKPIYEMKFKEEKPMDILSTVSYTQDEARFINTLIRKGYGLSYYIDHRPTSFTISTGLVNNFNNDYLFSQNVPLGFVDRYGRAMLYNYYEFQIVYRNVGENEYELLYSTVHPLSFWKPKYDEERHAVQVEDFLTLSERHKTDVQWSYSVKFIEDNEHKGSVFVPKMPLETKPLAKFYNEFLRSCFAVMATPVLVYLLTHHYANCADEPNTTLINVLPSITGACVFSVVTSLLWVLFSIILNDFSSAPLVISAAVSSPLIGLTASRQASTSGTTGSSLTHSIAGVAVVTLIFTALFVLLEAVTGDVKIMQVIMFIVGIGCLVLTPGSLLGHTIYERSGNFSKYLPTWLPRVAGALDAPEIDIDSPKENGEFTSAVLEKQNAGVATNAVAGEANTLSPPHQFVVVMSAVMLSSLPLCYPASELFFYFGYNRQFDAQRFRCHILLAFVQYVIPAFLSLRVLRSKIPMGRLFIFTLISVGIIEALFWNHFFKGFSVMNTKGGNLFVSKLIVGFYKWLDKYDTIYLGYFLTNMAVAHAILAIATFAGAVAF